MAGLLSRFRSVFNSQSQAHSQHNKDGISVELPSTFSLLTAQYGFYTTILGNIDDNKPLSVPQKLVLSVVERTLANPQARIKAVPRLPSVIPRLLQSLRDPKSSASDYVKIINKDPTLSAAVLKLANSVYFNPTSKKVNSIETAVVKLGIEGLRSVLSTAVMQPVIQRKSYYYSEFGHKLWTHSVCCAVACEIIAKQRHLEPFKAYLMGLVHDIGKITIFSELSNQFKQNQAQDQSQPGYAAFAPLMQSTSEALSYKVAQDWSLPEEICNALQQQIGLNAGDKVDAYAHVLYQANLACEIYAIAKDDPSQLPGARQALQDMQLPADLFEQLDSVSVDL